MELYSQAASGDCWRVVTWCLVVCIFQKKMDTVPGNDFCQWDYWMFYALSEERVAFFSTKMQMNALDFSGWQQSKWIFHVPPIRTQLEIQVSCWTITLNNQLKTSQIHVFQLKICRRIHVKASIAQKLTNYAQGWTSQSASLRLNPMHKEQSRHNYNRGAHIKHGRDIPWAHSLGNQGDCTTGSHRTPTI